MKIANRDAHKFVAQRHPFQGNNLYAQFRTQNNKDGTNGPDMWYVVYSYGEHWPLFVYADGLWFENKDKYGMTTSKHRSQAHPLCDTIRMPKAWMVMLARDGYAAVAAQRVLTGEPA